MITEAALITVSCVLFIQMGLSKAIQDFLHIDVGIVSCPKCCTFWICLCHFVLHDYGIIESVAASFIASYAATWLALVYDALAILYNYCYEQITQEPDTAEASERADSPTDLQADSDAVSQMHEII